MKKAKKLIGLLLACIMVFNMGITTLAAEGDPTFTMSLDKTEVQAGDTVKLTVAVDKDVENITTLMLKIKLQLDGANVGTDVTLENVNTVYDYANNLKKTASNLTISKLGDEFTMPAGTVAEFELKVEKAGTLTFDMASKSGITTTLEDGNAAYISVNYPDNLSVAVTEYQAPSYTGYAVTASEDKTVTAGENAQVDITVSNSDSAVTEYNAYDLTMTYDAAKLNLDSAVAADSDANITVDNGTIRVKGYGDAKSFDTAAVTLNFTAKAVGEAEVKITAANVDIGEHAISANAPDAAVLDNVTKITVDGYGVTLDEGLAADSLVAFPGQDYTFRATEEYYDYVVTATVGGEKVDVTDNGDGTYTIPGASITGGITVTAELTPKSYKVTIDEEEAAAATYGVDYVFTVEANKSLSKITIGENEYTGYKAENGTYTIPGADVIGNIVITTTAVEEPDTTVKVDKPGYVDGNDTATKGEDYDFSIQEEVGYDYGDLTVKVDGADITDKLIKNEDGSYTIPGAYVTGDITIEVERFEAISVNVDEYITLNGKTMFLVTVSGTFAEGNVAKYDNMNMYWSEKYNNGAYAYLVISADSLEDVKAAAAEKITVGAGAAAGTVDYSGEVNGTDLIDINDAQLAHDMYNAAYDSFDAVAMQKFLNADINADATVNVDDARAIVAVIK